MDYPELPTRLRAACEKLRRTPMAIADVIPMLQEAANALDAQRAAPVDLANLAKECGAATYTNRAIPGEPAFAFGNEAWAKFCSAVGSAAPVGDAQPVAGRDNLECELPPIGWHCSRPRGHVGSCAAIHVGGVTKEFCAQSPGIAAYIINRLAKQIDDAAAQPVEVQPLTDEQLDELALDEDGLPNSHLQFARAIEAAHGIKPAGEKGGES